jgi:aminoglycoside phosphotransferase (APT) family kinase protein
VRVLLREQHPELASLPLVQVGEGWDNYLFRLGEELAIRLPRRTIAAPLILNEQRWLPALAARLTLRVPAPLRIGVASSAFPWPWTVVPWLEGAPADMDAALDARHMAIDLGRFLRELHRPAPPDAPRNPWRGVPLAERASIVHKSMTQVGDRIDPQPLIRIWQEAVEAPRWPGPPLWLHGDLHPGNLLVRDGRLSAVIDFGDLTAGDPASDLSVAWMLLAARDREAFRAACSQGDAIDDDTWVRARGWALTLGLAYLAHSRDHPRWRAVAERTIDAVLEESMD